MTFILAAAGMVGMAVAFIWIIAICAMWVWTKSVERKWRK